MTTTTATELATQVYQVFIKATPEAIWDAITKPEFTTSTSTARASRRPARPARRCACSGPTATTGATRSSRSPTRRAGSWHGWRSLYDPELAAEQRAGSRGRSSRARAACAS